MASIIKLANKLPRIALPTAFPNGQAAQWTTDPYFETTVNGSPWTQGNGAFPNAVAAKNNGMTVRSGQGYQGMFLQSFLAFTGNPKIYVEIEALKGALWVYDSNTIITEPGAYIIDHPYVTVGQIWYYLADSYFTPYPTFADIAVGALPANSTTENTWFKSPTRKGNDNRLYLNTNLVPGTELLKYYNSWTANQNLVYDITVDYVPPGATVRVYNGGGSPLFDISAPGRYLTELASLGAGEMPTFASQVQAQGEMIVSRILIRRRTQQWVIEGDQFSKPTCLFMAEKNVFDQIISPQYQVSSNQYSRDNLASSIQPNIPQLGFCGYVPPSGMYRVGDTIYNPSGSPSGWRCVQAGNPGVWAPLPTL